MLGCRTCGRAGTGRADVRGSRRAKVGNARLKSVYSLERHKKVRSQKGSEQKKEDGK